MIWSYLGFQAIGKHHNYCIYAGCTDRYGIIYFYLIYPSFVRQRLN